MIRDAEYSLVDKMKGVDLLILDMDGVITGEHRYWDVAGLVAAEIFEDIVGLCPSNFTPATELEEFEDLARRREYYLSKGDIRRLKDLAISTNWDLCYIMSGLHFMNALLELRSRSWSAYNEVHWVLETEGLTRDSLRELGRLLDKHGVGLEHIIDGRITVEDFEWRMKKKGRFGHAYMDELNEMLQDYAFSLELFGKHLDFWQICYELFQEWYLGDELYEKAYGEHPESSKTGLIKHEELIVDDELVRATLEELISFGITIGMATGRPYHEITEPLKYKGLLSYFSPDHIATHREVEIAEETLGNKFEDICLSKPNPYLLIRAICGTRIERSLKEVEHMDDLINMCDKHRIRDSAFVGDAVSDMVAAEIIGCSAIGVLTGSSTEESLLEGGADAVLEDLTYLPRLFSRLRQISYQMR